MKGFGRKKSKNKKIKNLTADKFKEQIIYKAFKFHSEGNISEATKHYQSFIKHGFKDFRVFSNYGYILLGLGKFKEAELLLRKAIELKPDYEEAYLNLGNILQGLGKFKEAAISTHKAIELKPDFVIAYLNLGNILKNLGKLEDAKLSYHKAIELKPDFVDAHLNLGTILQGLSYYKDAELCIRKAIELKPDYAEAHLNLGNILKHLGQLEEAKLSYHKAIELKPDLTSANYSISTLQYSNEDKIWRDQLFSDEILNKKSKKSQVDIYFARANILHKEKKYDDSSKFLQLANNLKFDLNPFDYENFLKKSRTLLLEMDKKILKKIELKNSSENIFIVGMPRCGSTLLESIISMNNNVYALGEINILEESYLEYKESKKKKRIDELYIEKVNKKTRLNITTNKWLYNYRYAGIISDEIPNSKIIHCYRNPLDNILSLYRAHFTKGNQYSSSLVNCAKVYLEQEKIMDIYKNKFQSKIYNLNYDLLVSNPDKEIKSLISWLGWNWQDLYLSPHQNTRAIATRSSVEVRSPINSKSIGGWKNYREMLKPALEILTQSEKYRKLLS